MNKCLICILLMTSTIVASGQIKLPEPVNTDNYVLAAAMLPDSSIISWTGYDDSWKVVRHSFDGKVWVEQPNQLTDLLNGIAFGHLHFRFSNDFTKIVVMVHGKGDQKILQSEYKNGKWSYFKDIIDPSQYSYFNFTPSFSFDNSNLFLSDRSKPMNTFYVYGNTDTFSEVNKEKVTLEDFSEISDVIGIGNNSLIFHGYSKKLKGSPWFFIKKIDDSWTIPYQIKELEFGSSVFALSTTPFDEIMMYVNFSEGNIYLKETPEIIKEELQSSRKSRSNDIGIKEVVQQNQIQKESGPIKPIGDYYALLIGNSDYQNDELDLDKPLKDAEELKEVLIDYYSFDNDNVQILKNGTRSDIFRTLYEYRNNLTKDDNLLIFYAGHGEWDDKVSQGYWWPVDAEPNNPSNWLSNSDLREQIRGIGTAHTLLISDACFSGGIFKTRGAEDIKKASIDKQLLYKMPSRRAMTSGTLSTVPDKSVFFQYLVKYLRENNEKFISSSELFTKIRQTVINNTMVIPQDGVIMGTGDEGGDFIFIKK